MIPNEVVNYPGISRFDIVDTNNSILPIMHGRSMIVIVLVFFCLVYPPSASSQEFELVHHGDIVDVDVVGGSEFDWRGRLTPEGFLDGLNSFGEPIPGLCRSEEAIAADVRRAYSKYLRDPVVIVKVIDRSGRPVVILDGAVKLPQKFQMNRPATLRELLVLSGGIRDDASGEIQIFRPNTLDCSAPNAKRESTESNSLSILNITIKDLISGNAAANPLIRSGDIITVRVADVIYVIGGVVNPQQVSSRISLTLSRAIASAGGLTKHADTGSIVIYRRENRDTNRIEVDLKKIESGDVQDPPLKAFDIVEVAVKGAEKRKIPPIITTQIAVRKTIPLRIVE